MAVTPDRATTDRTITRDTPSNRNRRNRPTVGSSVGTLALPALVDRAVAGDERAWREIERRYRQMASGVARRAGVRPADVPDVLQHVWLQLFRTLPRLREPAFLAAWIRTTTRRESRRLLQRQDRQVPAPDVDLMRAARRDPKDPTEEIIVRQDLLTGVSRSARTLPPRCRQLLGVLLIDPTSSYQEIAERLDWPMGSVGPTKARCFVTLRRQGDLRPLAAGAC